MFPNAECFSVFREHWTFMLFSIIILNVLEQISLLWKNGGFWLFLNSADKVYKTGEWSYEKSKQDSDFK